ncbi:MAG: bifunctional N-acetylglucosamine-1-phosphate uridyltransferase/glucosamine-1-phosphate acetyltransferase [Chloroflexi bacterium]|nr:bifunctional N-acetylglucosamine-1-phosphate uridyltransferase/glucosamine-1-phosphate acetyltransferase [Chloroflexota bacterium]
MKLTAVILAAGKGTRMRSPLPKVLQPLAGKPMVRYSVSLAQRLSPEKPVLVIGHGADLVRAEIADQARYVVQSQQLGTGHAVLQTRSLLARQTDLVIVFAADMPLLTVDLLRQVVAAHSQHQGPLTLLTVISPNPRGFGRIVRDGQDQVLAIVEEVEATPEQKRIHELNAGVYCFDAEWLWPALERLQPSPTKGEYYLTDTVALANADGLSVMAVATEDADAVLGVNSKVHLSEAERVLRQRINHAWMSAGVTMIDPDTTYIMPDVHIAPGVELWPGVHLLGQTDIQTGCVIGPGAVLQNVRLGARTRVGTHVVLHDVEIPADQVISGESATGENAEHSTITGI